MRCALFATVLSVLLLAGCITTATTSPTPSPWDTSYRALDINASSQVVGCVDLSQVIQVQSQQYTFRNMRALTWTAQGGGTDLGSLATGSGSLGDPVTRYSVANGINKWGHVVGRSSLNRSEAHAFLLTSTGGMRGTLWGRALPTPRRHTHSSGRPSRE